MRISDEEVKKVLDRPGTVLDQAISELEKVNRLHNDPKIIRDVCQAVSHFPDREEMIESLRAMIAEGTYHPSANDIVEGMIRRTIADSIR